jgi:predicted transcriptional regulator
MAFKNRSRIEIVAAILQASVEPILKTQIMYKVYLSSLQLNEYLDMLTANKMMHFDKEIGTYAITTKGTNFLATYDTLDPLVIKR